MAKLSINNQSIYSSPNTRNWNYFWATLVCAFFFFSLESAGSFSVSLLFVCFRCQFWPRRFYQFPPSYPSQWFLHHHLFIVSFSFLVLSYLYDSFHRHRCVRKIQFCFLIIFNRSALLGSLQILLSRYDF